jgi:hypothetical protein
MEAVTPEVAAPQAPIAPAAPVAPVAAPMAAPQAPIMESGGEVSSSGGIKGFFSSFNWLEAGLCILGVSALSYVIYYYRYKLTQDKMINNELQRQIDEIKMNVQTGMKGKYKTI